MYQTIQVSSCVSVQGDLVESLPNGEAVIRDGNQLYRGRPIAPFAAAVAAVTHVLRAKPQDDRR